MTDTPSIPPTASPRTTAGDRVRDGVALALVVGGGALVVISHLRYGHLASNPIVVAKGESAFSQLFMPAYYMEMGGYAAAAAGVVVGIASYVVHARRTRRNAAADK